MAVATADNVQLRYDVYRRRAQHFVFLVGQRQCRRNYYGIARVHSDGIDVFHTAYGNSIAYGIAHGFEFYFFPTVNILFDQDLGNRRNLYAARRHCFQFLCGISHAAAVAAQGKRGAHDDGITYFFGCVQSLFHRRSYVRRYTRHIQRFHRFLEQLSVLRKADRIGVGTYQSDVMRL